MARAASAAQPGLASLPDLDEVGRVAFYNVGLQASALVGAQRSKWFGLLKADVIKAFSELRCDVLCLSEMGEVQVGLESAFAEAESNSSGVAQPAPGSLRRWFEGALQEVQAGDWGIYPRGHYVTLVRPDAGIEVEGESEVNIYPHQDFRVAQVLRCRTRTVPVVASGAPQPAQPFSFRWLCANVHCPSSKKRPYTSNARQGVLNGLVALSDGGTTPMVVGGDLNLGLVGLQVGLVNAGLPAKTAFIAKSREKNFKHGDLAVALGGLVALQENSDMGASFGDVSDAHDVVLVPLARVGSGVPSQKVSSASAGQPGQGLQLEPPAASAIAAQPGQEPRPPTPQPPPAAGKAPAAAASSAAPPPPPAEQLAQQPPPPPAEHLAQQVPPPPPLPPAGSPPASGTQAGEDPVRSARGHAPPPQSSMVRWQRAMAVAAAAARENHEPGPALLRHLAERRRGGARGDLPLAQAIVELRGVMERLRAESRRDVSRPPHRTEPAGLEDEREALIMGPLPPDATPRMVFEALECVMEDSDVVGVIIGPEHDQDWLRRPDLDGAYAEVWFRTADVAEEARELLPGQQLFHRWAWTMPLSFVISLEAQRDRSPTSAARGMGLGGPPS